MFLRYCVVLIGLLAVSMQVSASVKFKENVHYTKLAEPMPAGLATVTEFFYYGCTTCYELVPIIDEWAKRQEVDYSVIPAHSETVLVDAARMHHTADVIGELSTLYTVNYRMMQHEMPLQGADRVNHYLDQYKIDREAYWRAWSSAQVEQRLRDSAALTKQAQVFKTPTFIVHGVYKVDIEKMSSIEQLFEVLDFLVANPPAPAPVLLQKPKKD